MKTEKEMKKETEENQNPNVVELTELEKEKINLLRQSDQEYAQMCSNIGQKEIELALLKENAKSIYVKKNQDEHQFERELTNKYGQLRLLPDGRIEKVTNTN